MFLCGMVCSDKGIMTSNQKKKHQKNAVDAAVKRSVKVIGAEKEVRFAFVL